MPEAYVEAQIETRPLLGETPATRGKDAGDGGPASGGQRPRSYQCGAGAGQHSIILISLPNASCGPGGQEVPQAPRPCYVRRRQGEVRALPWAAGADPPAHSYLPQADQPWPDEPLSLSATPSAAPAACTARSAEKEDPVDNEFMFRNLVSRNRNLISRRGFLRCTTFVYSFIKLKLCFCRHQVRPRRLRWTDKPALPAIGRKKRTSSLQVSRLKMEYSTLLHVTSKSHAGFTC